MKDFIHQVRDELVAAQDDSKDPFYELDEVELEVSFALDITGGAKGKLVVVELGGESKASQTHRVKLKLIPIPVTSVEEVAADETPTDTKPGSKGGGGGGGGEFLGKRGPVYDKVKDPS